MKLYQILFFINENIIDKNIYITLIQIITFSNKFANKKQS